MPQDPYKNRVVLGILVLAICAFVGAAFYAFNSSLSMPDNSYLAAHPKARWIKLDLPFRLNARNNGSEITLFRRKFELKEPMDISLQLKAFRGAGVWLDGVPVRKFDGDMGKWREGIALVLPDLAAGKHELKIAVVNENAHPALLLWTEDVGVEALDISTPDGWEASRDDFVWNQAADVATPGSLQIANEFESSDQALLASLPLMLPLFLFGAGFVWLRESGKGPAFVRSIDFTPAQFRCILLGLWAVMAFNNFHDLPLKLGMDSVGHFKYIEYVAENFSLPSPLEGWQMFQPPLYYIISAAFYKFLLLFMDVESALYWLRLIPLACGAIMIEVCYRCAVKAFDENRFAQIGATLISGFLPMNFAMAQFWGNESLAAVFSALTILMCLIIIKDRDRRNLLDFALLGFCLGLAILSKATCTLLIPMVIFFVLLPLMAEKSDSSVDKGASLRGVLLCLIITAVSGGWYYLRNWLSYGKPFVGGWDKIREISWWQDHSYRIWEHFTSFGSAVIKPVYSTVNGIWDGLYSTLWLDANLSGMSKFTSRPPWDDQLMMATALLALVPSIMILAGIGRTFYKPVRSVFNGRMFLVACIVVYFTAEAYLYLNLPVYSTAKASYTLGLLPCYGILAMAGIKPLLKNIYVKSALCGFMTVWGTTIYLTYFV
ncbi:glycosyltransferase family 39 protein [Maridesulfovibrio sp.]|uniref:ArnT family glycosyltransferase n=1 Tax=Maridesulfovibrio sp. TaxID=2795000 RepID=UPI002A18E60B|nr:glycosyltransferase family 39 protein [Maridesulfovibrio sp.]